MQSVDAASRALLSLHTQHTDTTTGQSSDCTKMCQQNENLESALRRQGVVNPLGLNWQGTLSNARARIEIRDRSDARMVRVCVPWRPQGFRCSSALIVCDECEIDEHAKKSDTSHRQCRCSVALFSCGNRTLVKLSRFDTRDGTWRCGQPRSLVHGPSCKAIESRSSECHNGHGFIFGKGSKRHNS
jgi:hypothetical protein